MRRESHVYIDESFRVKKDSTGAKLKDRYYTKLSYYYELEDEYDDTLIFESRFECGNLQEAHRVGEYEYNLYM